MGLLSTIASFGFRRKNKSSNNYQESKKSNFEYQGNHTAVKPLGAKWLKEEKDIEKFLNPKTLDDFERNYRRALSEVVMLEGKEEAAKRLVEYQADELENKNYSKAQARILKRDITRASEIKLARELAQKELEDMVIKYSDASKEFAESYSTYNSQTYSERVRDSTLKESKPGYSLRTILMRESEKREGFTIPELEPGETNETLIEKARKMKGKISKFKKTVTKKKSVKKAA